MTKVLRVVWHTVSTILEQGITVVIITLSHPQRRPGLGGKLFIFGLFSDPFGKGGCVHAAGSEPLSRQRARRPKQDLGLETGRGSPSTTSGCFPAPAQEPSPAKPALLLKPQAAGTGWGQCPPLAKKLRLAGLFSDLPPNAQQTPRSKSTVYRAWSQLYLKGK